MGDNKMPEALKELRIQNGMTQAQFSKKLNIARQTYSAYERGVRTPDLDLVKNVAELYDVSLDWLVLGKRDTDPFASLPEDAGRLCRTFYALPPESQREALDFIDFLEQKSRTEP